MKLISDIRPGDFFSDFDSGSLTGLARIGPGEFAFELQSREAYGPQGSLMVWFHGACRLEDIDVREGGALRFVARKPHRLDKMRPVFSFDNALWSYVPEPYGPADDGFRFEVPLRPGAGCVWFAAHFPYPSSRYYNLCESASGRPGIRAYSIGTTELGRDILCVTVSGPPAFGHARRRVLLSAGSHAGETASLWGIEGIVDFLSSGCGEAWAMLRDTEFCIVPMLNVDGAALGLDRRNAAGVNLYFDYREFRAAESRAMWRLVEELRPDVWLDLHSWHLGVAEGAFAPDPEAVGEESYNTRIKPLIAAVGRHFTIRDCGRDTLDCPNTQALLRLGIPGFCPEFNMGLGADGAWKTPESNKLLGAAILRGIRDWLQKTLHVG